MPRKQTKPFYKKKLLLSTLLVVLLVGSTIGYLHFHKKQANTDITKQPTSNPYINLKPATSAEKQVSQDAKDAIVAQQNQDNTVPAAGSKKVTPIITNASGSSVSAYVSGVFEDGGTCTATFTQGSVTKTFTSTAFANVSYTSCAPMQVSGLSRGSWNLIVSYRSPTSSGESAVKTISV